MCGISFFVSKKALFPELRDSLDAMRHRGPDSSDILQTKIGDYYVGLGHNRLSVMDLTDSGKQPMHSETGVSIIFNGEIYNFSELKINLISRGHSFKTDTDTEVILRLYLEFGQESFSMLKGMFSFCILDPSIMKLIIVRDVVGVKPLYLYKKGTDQIIGCSEIKGLKRFPNVDFSISKDDVYDYFNNAFVREPNTGFKNIKKLLPGCKAIFDLSNGSYSESVFKTISDFHSEGELADKIGRAIRLQDRSDAPIGIFFSGGMDSSLLASLSSTPSLLFAEYDNDYFSNIDKEFSSKIADYLNKPLIVANLNDHDESIEGLIDKAKFVAHNTEELIGDYTFLATYNLSTLARNSGFKVMLSGMGGDEVFCGYNKYTVLKYHSWLKLLSPFFIFLHRKNYIPNSFSKKIERLVSYLSEKNWLIAYTRLVGFFNTTEIESFFSHDNSLQERYLARLESSIKDFSGDPSDKVKLSQYIDLRGFLAHNLLVADKASMLASIELRVPFLDEELVAHGLSLQTNSLVNGRTGKLPIKKVLQKLLPSVFVDRPKTGFNPPLDGFINKIGPERLLQEFRYLENFINTEIVFKIVSDHFDGISNNTYKLWQLLYFKFWIQMNSEEGVNIV